MLTRVKGGAVDSGWGGIEESARTAVDMVGERVETVAPKRGVFRDIQRYTWYYYR